MPNIHTAAEYADIVFVYGYCNGNARAAEVEYARKFLRRRLPDRSVFSCTFQRLRETGSTSLRSRADGIFAPLQNERRTEQILEHFDETPSSSTRICSLQLGYTQSTVNRTLKANGRHLYHLHKVQNLLPDDLPRRREFSEWFLQQTTNDAFFPRMVIWTDEATFTRAGIFNQHNAHIWQHENPHAVRDSHFQYQFSCNVWMGLCNDSLIGPIFLPTRLNGPAFLHFLENDFQPILDDMPLNDRVNRWFQLDGCPAHYILPVQRWLHDYFPGRWIGCGQDSRLPPPLACASNSIDLN